MSGFKDSSGIWQVSTVGFDMPFQKHYCEYMETQVEEQEDEDHLLDRSLKEPLYEYLKCLGNPTKQKFKPFN